MISTVSPAQALTIHWHGGPRAECTGSDSDRIRVGRRAAGPPCRRRELDHTVTGVSQAQRPGHSARERPLPGPARRPPGRARAASPRLAAPWQAGPAAWQWHDELSSSLRVPGRPGVPGGRPRRGRPRSRLGPERLAGVTVPVTPGDCGAVGLSRSPSLSRRLRVGGSGAGDHDHDS